jgi:hypothetical protein
MRWRPIREAEALNRGNAERKICPPAHAGGQVFQRSIFEIRSGMGSRLSQRLELPFAVECRAIRP